MVRELEQRSRHRRGHSMRAAPALRSTGADGTAVGTSANAARVPGAAVCTPWVKAACPADEPAPLEGYCDPPRRGSLGTTSHAQQASRDREYRDWTALPIMEQRSLSDVASRTTCNKDFLQLCMPHWNEASHLAQGSGNRPQRRFLLLRRTARGTESIS